MLVIYVHKNKKSVDFFNTDKTFQTKFAFVITINKATCFLYLFYFPTANYLNMYCYV